MGHAEICIRRCKRLPGGFSEIGYTVHQKTVPRTATLPPHVLQQYRSRIIPTPSQLDSGIEFASLIAVAMMSLEGIVDLRLYGYRWDDATAVELWPRIWNWVHFLNVYVETVAPFIPMSFARRST